MFKKNDRVIFNYENMSKEVVINMVYKNMDSDHHMYVVNDGEKNIFVDEGMLSLPIKKEFNKPYVDPDLGIFGALTVVGKSESGNEVIFKIKDTLIELNTTEIVIIMQGLQYGYEIIKPPSD